MNEGLVSYFQFEKLGFYRKNDEDEEHSEPLSMPELLENLSAWYQGRVDLRDTLMWDGESSGYQNRKKVYIKDISKNEETGDYLIFLWRAVGSGDGIYGLRADASLSDNTVFDANDATSGNDVIWGEPAYFWFIPSRNVFATVKFPRSISDTKILTTLLTDFVKLQSTLRNKVVKEVERETGGTYLSISFPSERGEYNLWFRCYSRMLTKVTNEADLAAMARDITHLVKREVVSARAEPLSTWQRLFSELPYLSSVTTKETRNVEVRIEAKPTPSELQQIFQTYNDNYAGGLDRWVNVGFQKEGAGRTVWLNEYVIKNYLTVAGVNYSGLYSMEQLFAALHLVRANLLAPIGDETATINNATTTIEIVA
jgi:hypothetical protein